MLLCGSNTNHLGFFSSSFSSLPFPQLADFVTPTRATLEPVGTLGLARTDEAGRYHPRSSLDPQHQRPPWNAKSARAQVHGSNRCSTQYNTDSLNMQLGGSTPYNSWGIYSANTTHGRRHHGGQHTPRTAKRNGHTSVHAATTHHHLPLYAPRADSWCSCSHAGRGGLLWPAREKRHAGCHCALRRARSRCPEALKTRHRRCFRSAVTYPTTQHTRRQGLMITRQQRVVKASHVWCRVDKKG